MNADRQEPVWWLDNEDPEAQRAYEQARLTFGYLWRELSWERRRVVPGLDLACVKTPFADSPLEQRQPGGAVEQMWMSDIDFDGRKISGTLLNSPNSLRSVSKGNACEFPLNRLTDWMYAREGRVYGAHTVNLLRSRMGVSERQCHDSAWGLDFGDPRQIVLVPRGRRGGR